MVGGLFFYKLTVGGLKNGKRLVVISRVNKSIIDGFWWNWFYSISDILMKNELWILKGSKVIAVSKGEK